MSENNNVSIEATPEQVLYAKILNKGMLLGLLILLVTFAVYVFGIAAPYVPLNELSNYWGLPVGEYLQQLNIPSGWGWVSMVKYGDFLNFIGVAILSGITILCYLAIVPTLLKNNDKVYALLAFLEAVILSLAASGLITAGH